MNNLGERFLVIYYANNKIIPANDLFYKYFMDYIVGTDNYKSEINQEIYYIESCDSTKEAIEEMNKINNEYNNLYSYVIFLIEDIIDKENFEYKTVGKILKEYHQSN